MEAGLTYTSTTAVTPDRLAGHVGSGDLPVLSTPAMLALMENAAMLCVAAHIPDGSTTVGSHISCAHLRPTAEGQTIRATATLTAIEGRKLTFRVEASDATGTIGEGTHVRHIVDRRHFLARLDA